ncbi:unnamed protein product [Amoebophrya sp. A25]|nr:unnamed protein product [Amoebophrya sp. A25]|eukprot:GSA25T00026392001.1
MMMPPTLLQQSSKKFSFIRVQPLRGGTDCSCVSSTYRRTSRPFSTSSFCPSLPSRPAISTSTTMGGKRSPLLGVQWQDKYDKLLLEVLEQGEKDEGEMSSSSFISSAGSRSDGPKDVEIPTGSGSTNSTTFLHRILQRARIVQKQRQKRFHIDQDCLKRGSNAVLQARKVIYLAIPENAKIGTPSDRVYLQASRQPAAVDLVAQLARARLQSGGGTRSSATTTRSWWLNVFGKGGGDLTVLPLESLKSDTIFFGNIYEERVEFWRKILEEECWNNSGGLES